MQTQLKDKLYADVEGTCTGRFGYIITVVTLQTISKGKILPGSGLAEFKVSYQAIVFKPYKGEVLDAVVTTVNKVRLGEGKGVIIALDGLNTPHFLDGFLRWCWTFASVCVKSC